MTTEQTADQKPEPNKKNKKLEKEPAAKANPALEGIQFAEEAVVESVAPLPPTKEHQAQTQQSAKRLLEKMKSVNMFSDPPKPRVVPLSEEEAERLAPKLFRVIREAKITRGAATYLLKAGKIITTRDYDIENLKHQGVEIEPVG